MISKIKLFVNFSQKVFYYTYVIRYYFEVYHFIVDQNIILCVYKKSDIYLILKYLLSLKGLGQNLEPNPTLKQKEIKQNSKLYT